MVQSSAPSTNTTSSCLTATCTVSQWHHYIVDLILHASCSTDSIAPPQPNTPASRPRTLLAGCAGLLPQLLLYIPHQTHTQLAPVLAHLLALTP